MTLKVPALLLFSAIFSFATEWSDAGIARCGGLFLWKGKYISADAENCQTSDTAYHGPFKAYAAFSATRLHLRWENFWTIRSDTRKAEATAGIAGDFPWIAINANVTGDTSYMRAKASSAIKWNDSLAYAGVNIGGGSFGKLNLNWISETENSLLDTIRGSYEGEYISKGIFAGGKYKQHEWKIDGEYFQTDRAPIRKQHYAFRDSSLLRKGTFDYAYSAKDSRVEILLYHLDLNAHLFGVRYYEGDTKRFLYLPIEAELNGAEESVEYKNWKFNAGYTRGYLKISKTTKRFEETLAPNRLLDYSLTEALSFSFYRKNYRLYGDAHAYLAHLKIQKEWEIPIHSWLLSPLAFGDFFYSEGEADITEQDETDVLITSQKKYTPYHGDLKISGTILQLALKLGSPQKALYTQIKCSQFIPLFLRKKLEEITTSNNSQKNSSTSPSGSSSGSSSEASPGGKVSSPIMNEENLTPFRAGFAIEIEAGFKF